MRSSTRLAVCSLLASCAALAVAGSGAAAPINSDAAANPLVVGFTTPGKLSDVTRTTIRGYPTGTGSCRFAFPKLTRQNGAPPVEARQVSTDFSNCTTVVETGTPQSIAGALPSGLSKAGVASRANRPETPARTTQTAALTDTHHFRVTWYDIVGFTVNWVQSNITATISGTCVTSASGSWNTWWLSGTGWSSHSVSSFINAPQCANRQVSTTTSFSNGLFCWPGTVWVYYNGVHVFRSYAAFSGWVDSTYEQNVFACPPLHWNGSLW
jgi:hypothetical protein